jgi:Domain of unknown function (DUF1835)
MEMWWAVGLEISYISLQTRTSPDCEDQNRFLSEITRETEIVLWFEHDRYDQTMLMYLLTELSKKEFMNLSMVTINEYEGVELFYGLG